MIKKGLPLLAALFVFGSTAAVCSAEIIPAYGVGQIGYSSVVLCESLSARVAPGADAEVVETLRYGDRIIVMSEKDGWAECALSDSVDAGDPCWVNASYVAIDPAWYKTDDITVIYAWPDTAAKRVGAIDKGTVLPILKDEGDWLIVSLRGATGWIHKTDADYAAESGTQVSSGQSGSGSGSSSGSGSGSSDESADSVPGSYYGEGAGLENIWAELGYDTSDEPENEVPGSYYGEGAGNENIWEELGYDTSDEPENEVPGSYYGEGAGLENNWEDWEDQ